MSKRTKIINSLVDLFNEKLNGIDYSSKVYNNTHNKLVFFDEINDFPYISIVAGPETREYLPSNFKWGFLEVFIRIYVEHEDPQNVLEQFFEDIEAILDANNNLVYDQGESIELINILSIDTDQGLFAPLGAGEIITQVQYDL